MGCRLSQHATERGWQRISLRWRALSRLALRAWQLGASPITFAGALRRYLDAREDRAGCAVKVYGEFVFIFNDRWEDEPKLVTVQLLPGRFRALLRRQRRLGDRRSGVDRRQGRDRRGSG